VLISYMWGTLTEGVDYKNARGRTVVIVGVGYPALNDRTRAVESAYDAEFGHGWNMLLKFRLSGRSGRPWDGWCVHLMIMVHEFSLTGVIRLHQRSVMVNIPSLNFSRKKKERKSLTWNPIASGIH